MTTVGYGDKNMRTVPGKIFATFWILFGIVGFGLLTGELTTHIMKLKSPQVDSMSNARVGVLLNRQYETFVASQHGATIVMNNDDDDDDDDDIGFYDDILLLLEKLSNKEIDGILLDMFTFKFLNTQTHTNHTGGSRWSAMKDFFYTTVRNRKHYEGETLTYGFLIKHTSDYNYFRDSIAEERLRIELTWDYVWNQMDHAALMSTTSEYYSLSSFNFILYGIMGVLGLVVTYGVVYEMCRKRKSSIRSHQNCAGHEQGNAFHVCLI